VRRACSEPSATLATAMTGPRNAKIRANGDPVIPQITRAPTTGVRHARNGNGCLAEIVGGAGKASGRSPGLATQSATIGVMRATCGRGWVEVITCPAKLVSVRWKPHTLWQGNTRCHRFSGGGVSAHDEELLTNIDAGSANHLVAQPRFATASGSIRFTHHRAIA
jgi:hypothetical protein